MYIAYYSLFYTFFFSFITHKEARFLLPCFPFGMIMVGEYFERRIKSKGCCSKFFIFLTKLYCITECVTLYVMETKFRGHFKVRDDLAKMDPPIHSAYLSEPLWTPHYLIMHRQENP